MKKTSPRCLKSPMKMYQAKFKQETTVPEVRHPTPVPKYFSPVKLDNKSSDQEK